jgi:hypothetical protein
MSGSTSADKYRQLLSEIPEDNRGTLSHTFLERMNDAGSLPITYDSTSRSRVEAKQFLNEMINRFSPSAGVPGGFVPRVWVEPELEDRRPPIQYEEPPPKFEGARGGLPEGFTVRRPNSDDDFILADPPPRGPLYEQSYIPEPEPAPEPSPVPGLNVPENLDEIINDTIAQQIISLLEPPPEPAEIPLLFPEFNNEPIPEPAPEIRQALIQM